MFMIIKKKNKFISWRSFLLLDTKIVKENKLQYNKKKKTKMEDKFHVYINIFYYSLHSVITILLF